MADPAVRRGRPPDTDPAETRRRILDAARHEFAERGFAAATNRTIASRAGLTTGALYHHYGSKTELYTAVHADAHDHVYAEFAHAVAELASVVATIDAVLDSAAAINAEDPTVAAFIAAARVDRRRHPELSAAIPDDRVRRTRFFGQLVDLGVAGGEIPPERRSEVVALIDTVVVGLNEVSLDGPRRQRAAIAAIKSMVRSTIA